MYVQMGLQMELGLMCLWAAVCMCVCVGVAKALQVRALRSDMDKEVTRAWVGISADGARKQRLAADT